MGVDNLLCVKYYEYGFVETWPSGKAEACKAFIPGSNPGVSFFHSDPFI